MTHCIKGSSPPLVIAGDVGDQLIAHVMSGTGVVAIAMACQMSRDRVVAALVRIITGPQEG
ncbi:MAG TPA: hypothetical protein VEB21_20270 [Terriglobales bacterium]|nr:hypothetical protein [Terriglobales bacterium]